LADLEETKRSTVLESADGVREDANLSVLVFGRQIVADEAKEGAEDPNSTKILMIRL